MLEFFPQHSFLVCIRCFGHEAETKEVRSPKRQCSCGSQLGPVSEALMTDKATPGLQSFQEFKHKRSEDDFKNLAYS